MQNNFYKHFVPIALLIGALALFNCGGSSNSDPWAALNTFNDPVKLADDVKGYHDATSGYESEENSVFDVYTEMSMDFRYMAYKMPYNREFASDIFFQMNKIHHYKIEISGVDDGGEINGKDDIMSKIDDPALYKSSGVDIEMGLKQLVEKNRPALLITDFEQLDKGDGIILDKAIFSEHFKDWLSRPNHSITLYYANFCDQEADLNARKTVEGKNIVPKRYLKKIFFAFFDVDKNKTFSSRALPPILKPQFQPMVIDIAPYKVSSQYASMESSGIGMGLEAQVTKVLQGLPDNAFEFINVGKYNWEFIDKTIQKNKGPFFKNLFVDASENAAFDLNKLGVRVTDVTDDFTHFVRCRHAKTLKPKIVQDKNGKNVFDPSNDPITKLVYNPLTGKLKPDWVYGISTPKQNPELPEIFTINNELVKNTKSKTSAKRISVETNMHPAYRLDKVTQKDGLLRVDIIAEEVAKNYSSFDSLVWDSPNKDGEVGSQNPKNTSLAKSIQSALKDLNDGQVIYSYYLRVLPSKE